MTDPTASNARIERRTRLLAAAAVTLQGLSDVLADREALSFEGRRLSYADLDVESNRLGHYLESIGIGKDEAAISIQRDCGRLSKATRRILHAEYGGVVPELASRDHVRKLLPLVRQTLADAGLAPMRTPFSMIQPSE